MLRKSKPLDLNALRNLPAVLEMQRAAAEERMTQRAEIISQIQQTRARHELQETELVSKAAPLERRIAALREQLRELESELAQLADARLSSMYSQKTAVQELQKTLLDDARDELTQFERELDATRNEISNDWSGRRAAVLARFNPHVSMPARTADALALTLQVFNEARRLAVEEADFVTALARLRERLRTAGIELVE